MRALSVLGVLLWCSLASSLAFGQSPDVVQAGDIIFHRSRSAQSRVIQEVTGSPWTHVGVVFERDEELFVLEAVQPLKWTPLHEWIRRGRGSEFALRRMREALSPEALAALQRGGERYLGRDYDSRFEWSEERIYCSELVWLMFEQALGIRLVEPQAWRELRLGRAARRLARRRLGHLPDPEALLVTPASLLTSESLMDPLMTQ